MSAELCHCGQPLHYTDPAIEAMVRREVQELGERIKVTVSGRSFMVPRHYIALHGITGRNVSTLGFEEVAT